MNECLNCQVKQSWDGWHAGATITVLAEYQSWEEVMELGGVREERKEKGHDMLREVGKP